MPKVECEVTRGKKKKKKKKNGSLIIELCYSTIPLNFYFLEEKKNLYFKSFSI